MFYNCIALKHLLWRGHLALMSCPSGKFKWDLCQLKQMSGSKSNLLSAHLASSDIVAINVLICSWALWHFNWYDLLMFISRRPLCHENYANSNKRQEVDQLCSFAHHELIFWTLKCLQWKSCQLQKRWGSWSCLLISRPLASSSFHQLPVNGLILFAVSASQKLICARALTSSSMFHTVSYTYL